MSRVEFETFRPIDDWQKSNLLQSEPSVFNGIVRVKRYRITCEQIEEPDEVIIGRLRKLYRESDNFHNVQPLQKAADEFSVKLSDWGKDRKKR